MRKELKYTIIAVFLTIIVLTMPACKSKADKAADYSAANAATAGTGTIAQTIPPTPNCNDGIKNNDEIGVDCGGSTCTQTCCEKYPRLYCPYTYVPGTATTNTGVTTNTATTTTTTATGTTTCKSNSQIPNICKSIPSCCNCIQDNNEEGVDCGRAACGWTCDNKPASYCCMQS